MVLERSDQRQYLADDHYFLHDKTQSVFKLRNIRNQCVDLFSSLIEIFGDLAIGSILKITKDMLGGVEDDSDDDQEDLLGQQQVEQVYVSQNPNHAWKRQDVAMILLGLFIEDIQMYSIRHPEANIPQIVDQVTKVDFNHKHASYLRGRCLWCAQSCIEALLQTNEKTAKLKNQIIDLSVYTLKLEHAKSIKLVATRALIKFTRKLKAEDLEQNAQKFGSILDDLLVLLQHSDKEVMHLPIQAFQVFSRFNQATVSIMAPQITPKLLSIFKDEHSESNLGAELTNLFKQWCVYP